MTEPTARPERPPETERCGRCLQTHAYETTVWCARCDRAVCAFCAVRTIGVREATCPDCGPAGAADRRR